jgi:class 3 adenylate cyclase
MIHRSDYLDAALLLYPSLALARAALGDGEGAYATLDELDRLSGVVAARYRALVALLTGDVAAAERWSMSATWRHGVSGPPTIYNVSSAVAAVELGVAVGDTELTRSGHRLLQDACETGLTWCLEWPTNLRRVVGLAAASLGLDTEADGLLSAAAAESDAAGSVWERARTELVRGSWAAKAEREMEAARSLSEAVGAFEACGAFESAARARHLATTLGVSLVAPATARVLRVIMMTDIVGSTAANHRLGDEAYLEVLRIHNRLTRHWLRQFGGVELKQTGDGFNAWFADAPSAVSCAIDLQRDFERWHAENPDLSVQIRCGLAAGTPLPHEQDLFGVALSEAARLCALAPVGGTLASDAVRELVGDGDGVGFESAGELELKGFPEPRSAFKVSGNLS